MKIVSLLPIYDPTNAAVVRRLSLMKAVSQLGEETCTYFLNSTVNAPSESYKILSNTNALPYWFALICKIRKIVNLLQKDDCVFLYGFSFWDCMLLTLFKRIKKYRLYNEITEYPDVVHFTGIKCVLFETFLLKRLDGLFVISDALRQYYLRKGIESSKLHKLNMLVDIDRFKGLCTTNVKHKVIAYCGSGVNKKDGVNLLIQAYSYVNKEFPDTRLLLIGGRPSPDYEENLQLIKSLNIEDTVSFIGPVHYENLPDILQSVDMLVLARPNNRQAEGGFPTKLGEYLCTGLPVVTTRVGEIPNYLTDGESVIFAKSANPEDIADSIKWILKNPMLARQIACQGKASVYSNFSGISQAKVLLQALNEFDTI